MNRTNCFCTLSFLCQSKNQSARLVSNINLTDIVLMAATVNNDSTSESSMIDDSPITNQITSMSQHPSQARGKHMMATGWKTDNLNDKTQSSTTTTLATSSCSPPIVYGELSILGYNGYVPNVERNGRKNKSKFLLCKRPSPNGIKKSRHYIVKQPSATKAIQDKDLHSISYTFSRSQTIIVEYRQDENTDMFQIGRSTEDPIDFVVNDTNSISNETSSSRHQHNHYHHHNENNLSNQQQSETNDLIGFNLRLHRQLAKAVGDDLAGLHHPPAYDPRNQRISNLHRHQAQAVLLNYPQPNISNLPHMMAEHMRNQELSMYEHHNHHPNSHQQYHNNHGGHSSGTHNYHHHHYQQQHQIRSPVRLNDHISPMTNNTSGEQDQNFSSRPNAAVICKRSHATQSTISRFACRILIDRHPPFTARIFAAGFDSSKNIFLGEKATKWEQDNSIDGLTTNGVLLMHPKQGQFYEDSSHEQTSQQNKLTELNSGACDNISSDKSTSNDAYMKKSKQNCSTSEPGNSNNINNISSEPSSNYDLATSNKVMTIDDKDETKSPHGSPRNDSNNNDDRRHRNLDGGGIWREVSVDGGIYAIRESRSAAQKGTRIEDEDNILRDGTLIDLCGATLLWRSVDGFKASPSKKSLEEKIDLINASRPQCPVGLNTLIIPRKPILPHNHRIGHSKEHSNKDSHQPYVYLKCGHVQGYHDWGATEKSNHRTCPICLSVGIVARLSMGLEPSFYVDSGPLTHVFNPCGHMASEKTVEYWSSIKIPHGTHFFHSICPFCATPLTTNDPAATKLIFQDLD